MSMIAPPAVSTAPGRNRLFDQKTLRQYLSEQQDVGLPISLERAATGVARWLGHLRAMGEATEATLEQTFNEHILAGVLGYRFSALNGHRSAIAKPGKHLTGISRTPDVLLGDLGNEPRWDGAVELKTPGTPLDKPQAGHNGETPIQQAFAYATSIIGVRWVLVSDLREIRLYSVEDDSAFHRIYLPDCTDEGAPTDHALELIALLHYERLVAAGEKAPVALLHTRRRARQFEIRSGFYDLYYRIRVDLFTELRAAATSQLNDPTTDQQLIEATQRLLDRLLFLYYCEDHPNQLIPRGTVKLVIESASHLPGVDSYRVYRALKGLFREVDAGSPPGSGISVFAYNGELFKEHPILDAVDLPDQLHHRIYQADIGNGQTRTVQGVWGLHAFDFWQELNEHLLGQIFEESLSDLPELTGQGESLSEAEKLTERQQRGIYYTAATLAEFLSDRTTRRWLAEHADPASGSDEHETRIATEEDRRETIGNMRLIDLACGSGAFLVAAYQRLASELERSADALLDLKGTRQLDLEEGVERLSRRELLRSAVHGVDLLPQAVEIAKLALWLRSAHARKSVPDLSGNIVAGDTLRLSKVLGGLGVPLEGFDLVLGNPPWGGTLNAGAVHELSQLLGIDDLNEWDSWEVFVATALACLNEGGRLGYVVPDTFLYEEKARLRRHLLEQATLEEVYVLGPGWFGPKVRMGTCLLIARKGSPDNWAELPSMVGVLLSGKDRDRAIRGEIMLDQITSQRGHNIPHQRIVEDPEHRIEVWRSARDDEIISTIETNSAPLHRWCEHGRGEEINRYGLLWRCPSCLATTVPGQKRKDRYLPKSCPICGLELTQENVDQTYLISSGPPQNKDSVGWIPGSQINHRYKPATIHYHLRLGEGWETKDPQIFYRPEKVLIRQAGVGINATLDTSGAYYPQSVYFYRFTPELRATGLDNRFLLGVLLSRTLAYWWFKRSAEVDVARAFPKVTIARLNHFPLPLIDLEDQKQRNCHDTIVEGVNAMLRGSPLGGDADQSIEQELRTLWKLSATEGAHINGEFYDIDDGGQVVSELFPGGAPSPMGRFNTA